MFLYRPTVFNRQFFQMFHQCCSTFIGKFFEHSRCTFATTFLKSAFQITLCRASFLPAGKFCGGFRAKKTGGFTLLTQYNQLFQGQKTDISPSGHWKILPPWIAFGMQKILYAASKITAKTSAFLPRYYTRKAPVFSYRAWWLRGQDRNLL